MKWQDGKLTEAAIMARLGGPLTVRYDGKTRTFATKKGERVQFAPPW